MGSSWSPKKKVRGVAKKLLKGISVQKEEDKSEDTMQKESTTTISCKSNDPMSIAAILKNPTTNDTIQSSKVETIVESSTTGARNQDTTVIKTPPTVLQRKIKCSKKRSTSFLSPEGFTIQRGEAGKRGKMFNFIKSELHYLKAEQEQEDRHYIRGISASSGSSKHSYTNADDSGSGWGSVPISGSGSGSKSGKESSGKDISKNTGKVKGKEIQY